ncbi:MAG TPA: hypothetical protein VMJ10_10495 [Kofleriaceae bacterium]|nr:hypothetical protein [Kofleriaceae bacterium]
MRKIVVVLATLAGACGGNSHGQSDATAPPADAAIDGAPTISELCGTSASGSGWQRCDANPLVTGMRPSADGRIEWTQADPTVMYDADDKLWKAWWSTVITADCSKLGTAEDVHEIDIKYAYSSDGLSWTIQAEPVLRSNVNPEEWDDTTVETPTVIKDPSAAPDHRYAMIYSGGNNAQLMVMGQTGWQLGLAFSADGTQFTKLPAAESPYAGKSTPFTQIDGLLLLSTDAFPSLSNLQPGIVADPELHVIGSTYDLYFSSLAVSAGTAVAYGISHATSTDLIHWTMTATNPVIDGGQTPAVQIGDDGTRTLWYHLDTDTSSEPSALFPTLGVWKVTSSDGIAFSAQATSRDLQWNSSYSYETYGWLPGVAVARGPDGIDRMYYSGWGSQPAPTGSCVFTKTGMVPGTASFDLATEP